MCVPARACWHNRRDQVPDGRYLRGFRFADPGNGSPQRTASWLTQGGSSHVTVRLGDRTTQLPMHGGSKELGQRLVAKIKKDLGLN